jgi:hypothetical protein
VKLNYYYSRRPRTRLRKRKKGLALASHQRMYPRHNSLRVYHPSFINRERYEGSLWGGLHKAWLGYVIAKSQCDCEKMRKYATAIQKFERLLNIEINEFPELGLYTFDAFEDKEEDDNSKLAVINPLTNEKLQEAKEDTDDYAEVDWELIEHKKLANN